MWRLRTPVLSVIGAAVALSAAMLGGPGLPAAAAAVTGHPQSVGKPWSLPAQPAPNHDLPVLGGGSDDANGSTSEAATAAASAQARATGKPTLVNALTTETSTVTAEPNGTEVATDNVLPVRVHSGGRWVPVNTSLRRVGAGFAPTAIPGDTVTFSRGGTGPMAVISASGTSLALSWPGTLPAPVVAGSSATYPNVLPGVDLVLTATSSVSGGFSEVLVIRRPAAARDPGLASLALRVTTSGTAALRETAGGGLAAAMIRGGGSYVAVPPAMWDSSWVAPGAATVRSAAASARSVGANLAAEGTGPRSSATGPASGARLARVGARVSADGTTLALTPDQRMLTSPSTQFPVYIDPGFQVVTDTGDSQDYDPVQSECPESHLNSPSYSHSPVGYADFDDGGQCDENDIDFTVYQVAIPPGTFGPHAVLINASLQATEVYSSSCSTSPTVTASWVDGLSSGPDGWPGPSVDPSNAVVTTQVGPDSPDSCDEYEDFSATKSFGFNLTPDLKKISSASAITLRLWEQGNTNGQSGSTYDTDDADHKQFSDDATLQVTYTDTPNTPTGLEEASNSSGADSLACGTSLTDPPRIGKTDYTNGPWLDADYSDVDGATVEGNVQYWYYVPGETTPSAVTSASAGTNVSGQAGAQIPASYLSGLEDGTVIAWQAQAVTGSESLDGGTYGPYTSPWSATCYFAVYSQAPDPPGLQANFDQTTAQPVGTSLSFTITQSTQPADDPATEFVWWTDEMPPTTGTVPTAHTCTTTATEADCSEITNGSATLTIAVTAPGPHDLWVYEVDAGGNDSQPTDDQPAGYVSTFLGNGDPNVQYTSGTSLQANFDLALGPAVVPAGQTLPSYDNSMISSEAGQPGMADGDGDGDALDEAQLRAAGWNPGGVVTVDGATFTLPNFDPTGATGADTVNYTDNLLAANQTIGTGPSGVQGASALVFLATSTNADAAMGAQGAGTLAGDPTAPAVTSGTPVTGSDCDLAALDGDDDSACTPATGQINYAAGCALTSSYTYTLTVPDWITGQSDIAALTLPDRDSPTGQQADSPKIYAFAVPVDPSCTVTSVRLPDVSAAVMGATRPQPALHIFGMALRNTTTATPEADGTVVTTPSGQGWTGAFESPIEDAYEAGSAWTGDQTVRISVSPNVNAPAGAQVRIKLSDPGFLSDDGTGPLVIGAATIGDYYYSAAAASLQTLTFGSSNSSSVTIPEGGDIYSNPLTLPFSITPGTSVMVSLWLQNASLPVLPLNSWASGGLAWFSPSSMGNQTANPDATPFTGPGSTLIGAVPLLTALDVTTSAETFTVNGTTVTTPGEPTVVVAGDNVIDGFTSDAQSDATNVPSQRLAGLLSSQGAASGYGVVDAGVQSNQVVADGTSEGGVSLLARLDADILAEPDVGTVVIDEGLEDVLLSGGAADLADTLWNGYQLLQTQLTDFGITSITGDLTPCGGYSNSTVGDSCSAAVESQRVEVNSLIDAESACPALFSDAVGDTASAASDGASTETSPETLASGYGTADGVNLTLGANGGYGQLANAVVAAGPPCGLTPPQTPGTAVF
jgi:hypothetical protein